MLPSEPQSNSHIHILKAFASSLGLASKRNSFSLSWCLATGQFCLLLAIVGNYTAEHPHFHGGAFSQSRHQQWWGPFLSGFCSPDLRAEQCSRPRSVSGPRAENACTDNARVWHAFAGQGHAGSSSDTTHPTQRNTATLRLSQMRSLVCY